MKTLLLASASPARRATLRAAGIDPVIEVSAVDEEALLAQLPARAREQVTALATAKAEDVAERIRATGGTCADVVVGCDSMFEIDGAIVGKPHTPEIARERLRIMSDNTGVLYTGHCVIDTASGHLVTGVSTATVHIGHLSDAEIEAYIATGEPLWVAGSFTIDGLGGPFIESIEGDHHGVVGISLPLLRHLLAELGHSITEFWTPPIEH